MNVPNLKCIQVTMQAQYEDFSSFKGMFRTVICLIYARSYNQTSVNCRQGPQLKLCE